MENPVKKEWLMLPDLVLSDIMKKIALESISTLRICAEVCTRWEQEIMSNPVIQDIARTKTMTALGPGEFPSSEDISNAKWLETRGILEIGVIENLVERVKEEMNDFRYQITQLTVPVLTCAASLAHHGLYGSVFMMRLPNVDLTSVPAEHLASLVSCVEWKVEISNNTCVVTILDNVNSYELDIEFQSLSSEETAALVRAMESRVEDVSLNDDVTLDIKGLMDYSGQGKCKVLKCWEDTTADRYREQLMTWAKSRSGCGWEWSDDIVQPDPDHSFNGLYRWFSIKRDMLK